jgi:hypothetical protein
MPRARRWRRWMRSAPMPASAVPSALPAPPAIMRSRAGPWGSASSATRSSPPGMRSGRTGWRAWPSWISTCITATAPRRRCGTMRPSCSLPATNRPAIPSRGMRRRRGWAISSTPRCHRGRMAPPSAPRGRSGCCRRWIAFAPELLVVSAGFDAHARDPLAQLRVREADFGWLTQEICRIADHLCGGRVVSLLEGGYDLDALATSTAAHVRALMA